MSTETDPTSSTPISISSRDIPLERSLKVNDSLANLTGGLAPVNRRKVFAWSSGVLSDTDVMAGMVTVRSYQQSGGKGQLCMTNDRKFYMNGSVRVYYDEIDDSAPVPSDTVPGSCATPATGTVSGGRRRRKIRSSPVVVNGSGSIIPG